MGWNPGMTLKNLSPFLRSLNTVLQSKNLTKVFWGFIVYQYLPNQESDNQLPGGDVEGSFEEVKITYREHA